VIQLYSPLFVATLLKGNPALTRLTGCRLLEIEKSDKLTRKYCTPIKVYYLPEGKSQIEVNVNITGLSVAAFLRKVEMGYE